MYILGFIRILHKIRLDKLYVFPYNPSCQTAKASCNEARYFCRFLFSGKEGYENEHSHRDLWYHGIQ